MDIFKLVGSVFVDTEEANNSLKKTDENAEGLGNKLGKLASGAGKLAIGIGTATASASAAILGVAQSAASSLDEIQKGAQQLSISYEAYQKLNYAAERSGTSIDAMSKGIKNLTKNLDEAKSSETGTTAIFEELGISVQNADGSFKSTEETLMDTISVLADMEDETQRNALANELFGGSYQDLLPLLNSGSEGIQDLMQNAENLGLVMSDESVDAGAAFCDQLDDVKDSLTAVMTNIGTVLMPVVQSALGWITEHMPQIQAVLGAVFDFLGKVVPVIIEWISKIITWLADAWENKGRGIFQNIVEVCKAIFDKIMEWIPIIVNVVKNAVSSIVQFWNEHLKPCFDAIIAVIQEYLVPAFQWAFETIIKPLFNNFVSFFTDLWEKTLKPIFTNIIDFIKNVFTGNFTGAFENIKNIIGAIWEGLVTAIKLPLNNLIVYFNAFLAGITSGINVLLGALNKLKIDVPDWVTDMTGIESFGFNFGMLQAPNIPTLQEGGVLEKGQLGLLEGNGAEAVVPLDQNEKWIKAVADDMSKATSNDALIAKLDEVINAINDLDMTEVVKLVPDDRKLFKIVQEQSRQASRLGTANYAF